MLPYEKHIEGIWQLLVITDPFLLFAMRMQEKQEAWGPKSPPKSVSQQAGSFRFPWVAHFRLGHEGVQRTRSLPNRVWVCCAMPGHTCSASQALDRQAWQRQAAECGAHIRRAHAQPSQDNLALTSAKATLP